MAKPSPPISFSARRRWGIFFSVIISITAMTAIVIMLNYLGARHFLRASWSRQTRDPLSPQTVNLIKSVTNDVKVILYFDQADHLYDYIADILGECRLLNPKISVRTVNYIRDAAAATQIKAAYAESL